MVFHRPFNYNFSHYFYGDVIFIAFLCGFYVNKFIINEWGE